MISPRLKLSWKFLIILALTASFFFRLFPILNDTTHFSFDQGLDLIMTKKLVVDHQISFVSRYSGLQGVLMGPIWTIFLAIPFAISGGNPSANIVFMSVFNVIVSSIAAVFLGKKFGNTVGIFSWIFFLFSPSFVTGSQVILSPYPLIPLFIFFPLLSFGILVQKKSSLTWLLFLLLGIYFQFEIGFAIFALFAFAVLFIYFRGWWLIKNWSFWIGSGLFFITFLPQIIFDLRHDFLISKGLLTFITGANTSLYRDSAPLITRFGQRLYSFYEDATAMAFFGHWTINLTLLFFAVYGWAIALKKDPKHFKNIFKILFLTMIAFFLGFSIYPGPIWGWYRIGLPGVYVLLVTLPLAALWVYARNFRLVILVVLTILFLVGLNPLSLYSLYKNSGEGGVGTLRNQKQVIDYVYSRSQGKPFNYLAYTPPVYDYIWQYDFWWYGRQKYGYLPTNWHLNVPLLGIGEQSKAPSGDTTPLFLIIEPNSDHPDEPRNWSENVKVGKTVSKTTLPGGIIVEKRIGKN